MEPIQTKDGSYTLYNPKVKESYHSVSGAISEAMQKYVMPCKIADGHHILDICFGLGYNAATAMIRAHVTVTALEKDNLLSYLDSFTIPKEILSIYSDIKNAYRYPGTTICSRSSSLTMHLGDARQTIKRCGVKVDAVFLDPFSTMKNPELWTVEFFQSIMKVMKSTAILATYSSSAIVRAGLLEAGFFIGNGPVVGRARPGTVASLIDIFPPLPVEDQKLITAFGTPFRDPSHIASPEEIRSNRLL